MQPLMAERKTGLCLPQVLEKPESWVWTDSGLSKVKQNQQEHRIKQVGVFWGLLTDQNIPFLIKNKKH